MQPDDRTAPTNAGLLLDLIRSDQMTSQQVEHLLADNPEFAKWYREQVRQGKPA